MASILRTLPLVTGATRNWLKGLALQVFLLPGKGTDLFLVWEQRMRDRDALGKLDARLLDDMGMTPEDAMRESGKPFWRG